MRFYVFHLLLLLPFIHSSMDQSETSTLFTIMESMSDDHTWRLSHPHPCHPTSTWPGLECKQTADHKTHVSRLDFGYPPNPKCKTTAKFPLEIFNLPYLQSAFFFNCFTDSKYSVSSPIKFSFGSSSIQQLSLRSNPGLAGPIPHHLLASLKSLESLTLAQNHHTGPIPLHIFDLTSLVHLDLSYNLLSGTVPNQFANLKSLVGLDLSYNSLSGNIPNEIGDLGKLQKLDLSSNMLHGRIPDSIENLASLNFIALSNNKLNGYFPKGMMKLQSLEYFLMDDNPMFIPLPFEVGKLVKLQELGLANSGYSGSIPQSYSQLLNLTTLSVQNNLLVGEIPAGLDKLPRIYHLNLSGNMLNGVVPFSPISLERLGRNLDLNGNPGLCLSSSEEDYSVKIGVDVCGRNKTGSVILPVKESMAASSLSGSLYRIILSSVVILWLLNLAVGYI